MKIVIVSTYYSKGMGYAENCLPKALSAIGHEVHVVASNWNIYGDYPIYDKVYKSYLGPADQGVGKFDIDGYTVHRLPSRMVAGYIYIKGMYSKIKEISPDVVHSMEIGSLQTFFLALIGPFFRFKLFTETHQHLSVVKQYLKESGHFFKKLIYKLTRTLPTYLASISVIKCYAISPDCAYVANVYFGVPNRKIKVQSLGTDTQLFKPAMFDIEIKNRGKLRAEMGYDANDIVCIYTGRFSSDKNPLLLALAVDKLAKSGMPFQALFIGEGIQKEQIETLANTKIIPFVKHATLADFYRCADIGVWPMQESMSMLDAAASGLPLIVSDKMGDYDRIEGNGIGYTEGDFQNLSMHLKDFLDIDRRVNYGEAGRKKMVEHYSWEKLALNIIDDYAAALNKKND